jgi:adenosylcobinamide-GDP ribazoletransferase
VRNIGGVSFLRQYLIAIQFFTRLPVTGPLAQWAGLRPEMPRTGAAHLPGVGMLVGLVACTVFALLGVALPGSPYSSLVAAIACTMATLALTGSFHEDAAAHLADGLAGGARGQEALEQMEDSRLGSHGVLALVLALLAKVALLAVLAGQSPATVMAALLAGHVVSRFWPLLLMRSLPYLGDPRSGDGDLLAPRIDRTALAIGAEWCVVPLAIALLVQVPAFALLAVVFSGLALLAMRGLLARRLNGFNRDGVGAAQQACEIAFYLGAAAALGLG